MEIVEINGMEIEVEHKAIKHLHLAVYPPDGRVHVSAPNECSLERVRLYVASKWMWIAEKRKALTSYNIQPPREFVSGEAHYFFGQLYRLKVVRDGRVPQHVEVNGDYLMVYVRPSAEAQHVEAVLHGWYKTELEPVISGMMEEYEAKLGVKAEHWEIRKMQSRWGSCSSAKRSILFNSELAKKPKSCISYVVLHELCHLVCRNHDKEFKRLLDKYMPNWVEVKNDLNEFPL